MRKTTINIDDEKIAEAREILGTSGISDTLNAALDEIVQRERRRKALEWFTRPDAFELPPGAAKEFEREKLNRLLR